MATIRVKSEEQWLNLEQNFRDLREENPEAESFRVLIWVVTESAYNTTNIKRGVNRLVDVSDYCDESPYVCRQKCGRYHSKKALKNHLTDFAYPPQKQIVWRNQEEITNIN